mmetsp:Transcript_17804/g.49376  ORF Transcript_17804/g.49376 Transcript_17804/m.49376 type:complete len:261 (-) Transcript_17804:1006-1788(-)
MRRRTPNQGHLHTILGIGDDHLQSLPKSLGALVFEALVGLTPGGLSLGPDVIWLVAGAVQMQHELALGAQRGVQQRRVRDGHHVLLSGDVVPGCHRGVVGQQGRQIQARGIQADVEVEVGARHRSGCPVLLDDLQQLRLLPRRGGIPRQQLGGVPDGGIADHRLGSPELAATALAFLRAGAAVAHAHGAPALEHELADPDARAHDAAVALHCLHQRIDHGAHAAPGVSQTAGCRIVHLVHREGHRRSRGPGAVQAGDREC